MRDKQFRAEQLAQQDMKAAGGYFNFPKGWEASDSETQERIQNFLNERREYWLNRLT